MGTLVQLRAQFTSPACGRGRRAAPGEGSLLLGVLACGDTLSPTLPRKRGRGATFFAAGGGGLA